MQNLRSQYNTLLILSLAGSVPALFCYLLFQQQIFLGLTWNVFLGLLPFYFAIKANGQANRYIRWFNALLWLLFLPNAPYVMTDLIHVKQNPGYEGFVVYLVAVLSFTGLLSWIFSVRIMLSRLPGILKHWNILRVYGYRILCLLSGIGVAMGRYARLNSWEIFYEPWNILSATLRMYAHPAPWFLTIAFTMLLYWAGKTTRGLLPFPIK